MTGKRTVDEDLVLRFASSLEWRYTRKEDHFATATSMAEWLSDERLPVRLGTLGAADLAAAHELREALYGLGRNVVMRKPLDRGDVEVVNQFAARVPLTPALDSSEGLRFDGDSTALLSSIARAAIDLFSGPGRTCIRQCGAHECTQLFVDRSRTRARQWCRKACADRMKSAAYRQRKKKTRAGRPPQPGQS